MHVPKFSLFATNTGDYNYSHRATLGEGKIDQNNTDILDSTLIPRLSPHPWPEPAGYISSDQTKGDAALMLTALLALASRYFNL